MSEKLVGVIPFAFLPVLVLQIVVAVFVAWYIYRSCYRYVSYKVSIVISLHFPGQLEY